MSSFLRGSTHYVWCTTSVLGKGATGSVFQGVNRHNGEPVAVKTFNPVSQMRPHDVQVREFEVLKKVKHENIVKLLAIEEEQGQDSRGKVIVMELCTGGSLFNILDDPENKYGLCENEFLLVLEHVTAGMKHLRDNNLVHRDLKPGNIMKFIADDGRTIYKLTDFGAARELQEDQQFMSLYGTEEYLHPDLYERAVLRKPVGKTFGATVDLWSIGVTLYHVATGSLPFRPYGGRRNRETMYYITTKKAPGVISGTQSSDNGQIEWSRELPSSCQLSIGLKKYVTPLIAGLLESDPQKIWSFDKFFAEVTSTLCRKVIHFFYVNKVQSMKIYLHPDDTYEEFQCSIFEQTNVTQVNQILIFNNLSLLSVVTESTPGRSYPTTEEQNPVMLFSKENNNITLGFEINNPKFPVFENTTDSDATAAKTSCSVGHAYKRQIETLTKSSFLIHACVEQFTSVIMADLEQIKRKNDKIEELYDWARKTIDSMVRNHKAIETQVGIPELAMGSINCQKEINATNRSLESDISTAVRNLCQRYITEHTLSEEWSNSSRGVGCPYQSRAPSRACTAVDRLRDSWQHLLRDRATRNLTYNDQQFHELEKVKISENSRVLKSLFENDCHSAILQLAESLADWYKMAQTVFVQIQILDKDSDQYEQRLNKFGDRLSEIDLLFHKNLKTTSVLKSAHRKVPRVKEEKRSFRNGLKNIKLVQEEIANLVKENSEIATQFKHLTLSANITEDNNLK